MSTLTEGKYRFFTIFVERSTLFQTNDKLCLRFFRSLLLLLSYSTQNLVKFYSFIYYLFIYLLIYLFIYLFIHLFSYTLFTKVDNHHLKNIQLNIVQLLYIAMQIRIGPC